jgi:hypothetical protein
MKERRQHPRYPARWRVTVHCDCQHKNEAATLHGTTGDVSLGGATIHTKHNFCAQKDVLVILDIPPVHAGGRMHHLQIRARTTYTVLDGSLNLFRSGLQFLHLTEHDHHLLEQHLESRFSAFPIRGADQAPRPFGK